VKESPFHDRLRHSGSNSVADTLYETKLKANRRTAEYRISNVEGWIRFAQAFLKIDRIHYSMFDVGRSMFDVRCSLVSLSIKLAVFLASGDAHMKLQMFRTVGRATVPADTGRHGGRPYDSTNPKLLF
jgi:hypothetical protein